MGKKEYDKLATRFALILTKLENDERPTKESLAEEFNVSMRTIERDLNRLDFFPIEKNDDKTFSFQEGFSLSRVSFNDIEKLLIFLSMDVIDDINSSFSHAANVIKSKFLTPDFDSAYIIKQEPFEEIDINSQKMKLITKGIEQKRIVEFTLDGVDYSVEPYKIMSIDEMWYLFAEDLGTHKYKTFFVNDISHLELTQKSFHKNEGVDAVIDSIQTQWFEDSASIKVVLHVSKEVAHYFKRKKHLPSQVIDKENTDGSIIATFMVTTEEEIDNLVKAWIPHVNVIEPVHFNQKLKQELLEYIESLR